MQEVITLGQVMKRIRKERKLTQKMLSHKICSQSVLSRIENDEELPNILVMQQLCERLGVTMDQVVYAQSYEMQAVHQLVTQMEELFFHQQYRQLKHLMEQEQVVEQLYLDADLQAYYYYRGSCEYFLSENVDAAIAYLRQGLAFTYNQDKEHVTVMEIQLLSCLGWTLTLRKDPTGEKLLQKAVDLAVHLPNQRKTAQLTKVYFNYAQFLIGKQQFQSALEVVAKGIAWAQKKKSFYYLEELLIAKSVVLESLNQKEEAQRFIRLAEEVKFLTNHLNGVDLS
ncbi:MAG: helix-turn-helix domain-containing protein [Enterococcus sp.]